MTGKPGTGDPSEEIQQFGVEGLIWHTVVLEEEQRKKGRGEERSQVMILSD